MKKWQKVLKTVHFLVNYVTFVIDSKVNTCEIFRSWLWVCLLHTKTFLFYINFLTTKRDVTFFLKKWLVYGPPFFVIHFSQILSRICTPILSSIRTVVLEKNDFFVKNWPFLKSKLSQLSRHWRVPAFNGRYQAIRHTLYYRKVSFLWFHLFSFLKVDQFFHEKVAKSFKNCPLSRKLRDFCYSLL